MEQELRFGLDLGRLALLKKNMVADYEQLLRPVFSLFRGQKRFLTFFWKHYSVCTEKLHNTFFTNFFLNFLNPRKWKKWFFLGLKFEWNLSVNTWRSGTDYCWLYCDLYLINFECPNSKLYGWNYVTPRPECSDIQGI